MSANAQRRNPKDILKVLLSPFSRSRLKLELKIERIRYQIRYANFRPTISSDGIVSGIRIHEAALANFLKNGDTEMFLSRLAELMLKLLSESFMGRALFVPRLDDLARKANLLISPDRKSHDRPTNSKVLVHVATIVYPIGGHTRVIEDIAAALPDHRHILLITGMQESDPVWASLKPRFDELSLEVYILRSSSLTEKTRGVIFTYCFVRTPDSTAPCPSI